MWSAQPFDQPCTSRTGAAPYERRSALRCTSVASGLRTRYDVHPAAAATAEPARTSASAASVARRARRLGMLARLGRVGLGMSAILRAGAAHWSTGHSESPLSI